MLAKDQTKSQGMTTKDYGHCALMSLDMEGTLDFDCYSLGDVITLSILDQFNQSL